MIFKKIGYFDQNSFTPEVDTFFLVTDSWNDQGYYTYFHLIYCGSDLVKNKIGTLRIAFKGQEEGVSTDIKITQVFNKLDDNFYSLGTDEEYYLNLKKLDPSIQLEILDSLNDVAKKKSLLEEVKSEGAFLKAFLRNTSILNIEQKFRKIINDEIILTDFNFQFDIIASNKNYPITLDFDVLKDSMPPTNIHTIIGRNGVGKTHILNSMIEAITSNSDEVFFSEKVNDYFSEEKSIKIDYPFFS